MLPVQASNSWGRTSDRGCGYGPPPSAWPGPSAGTGRTVPPRWIVKPARSTAAAVSRPWASAIRRDQSGVRRSCQRARLPQPCAGQLIRRPRPWLTEDRVMAASCAGARRATGRSRRQPRTPLRAAGTPIHASSAASKDTSPAPAAIDSSRAYRWPRHCHHPASRKPPPTSLASSTPGTRQSLNGVPASTAGSARSSDPSGEAANSTPQPGPQPRVTSSNATSARRPTPGPRTSASRSAWSRPPARAVSLMPRR
jgi:hypothetical protein